MIKAQALEKLIKKSLPVILLQANDLLYLRSERFVYRFDLDNIEEEEQREKIERVLYKNFKSIPANGRGLRTNYKDSKTMVTEDLNYKKYEETVKFIDSLFSINNLMNATKTGLVTGTYDIFYKKDMTYTQVDSLCTAILVPPEMVKFDCEYRYIIFSIEDGMVALRCFDSPSTSFLKDDAPIQLSIEDIQEDRVND